MQQKEIVIRHNGFNVVFAKKLTTAAETFTSEIRIIWKKKNIISDGKSILGVMALDVVKGSEIILTAEGPDEDRAIAELADIFAREDY